MSSKGHIGEEQDKSLGMSRIISSIFYLFNKVSPIEIEISFSFKLFSLSKKDRLDFQKQT